MHLVRTTTLLAALTVLACAPAAAGTGTKTAYQPIRPVSNCMDLSRNPEIYTPSDKTVIVKTGPKYFRIDLDNNCGRLNAATLDFKIAADKRSSHRMCGELGDQVINADGLRCTVRRVTPIGPAEFKRLEAMSKARR